jgi:hypothetical protein
MGLVFFPEFSTPAADVCNSVACHGAARAAGMLIVDGSVAAHGIGLLRHQPLKDHFQGKKTQFC